MQRYTPKETMDIPSSYKSFLRNISKIEFRYPESSFAILQFGFYELILNDIIGVVTDKNQALIVFLKSKTENKFYSLLIRPIGNGWMPLNKYITRIGIYGYYLSNIFSNNSIKKVLTRELKKNGIIEIRRLLFFNKYIIRDDIKKILETYNYAAEKEKIISTLKLKLELDDNSFTKFNTIIETELSRSVHPIGWGINSLGK